MAYFKIQFLKKFIDLLRTVLTLLCCVGFSLVPASGGYSLVAVLRLLIEVASLVGEQGLQDEWASVVAACGLSSRGSQALEHRLSSCGARAQLLRPRWDLPDPGIEPVSPASAGGFFTTEPPGNPLKYSLC